MRYARATMRATLPALVLILSAEFAGAAQQPDRWLYQMAERGQSAAALRAACGEPGPKLHPHCHTVIVSVLSMHYAMTADRPDVASFCPSNISIQQARAAFLRWYDRLGVGTPANVEPALSMPGGVAMLAALHQEFPCLR
jgi:hypothetical protein